MPTKYVHFTDEQKEQARQTDLCELLRSQGETLKRSGTEYEWKDGSQKVTIRGNLWFHQYDQQGGSGVRFLFAIMLNLHNGVFILHHYGGLHNLWDGLIILEYRL